jgi:hypothetical protein
MEQISAIGLDIAKQYFQVHGADNVGNPVLRRKLRRNQVLKFFTEFPRCRVGIEACSTAHHWARAIAALGGERLRSQMFAELQSHYLFEDRFGRPGKGNDKGKVEGLVGHVRR